MSKLSNCPHCGGDLLGAVDGRAEWWSFRVRLYDMNLNRAEPMPGADSDGDLEADQPGKEVARGLWKVAHEAAAAAGGYHGCALRGLTGDVLERKVRGLRPTLSRNAGRATMRIAYDTMESFSGEGNERYMIRVDIAKAEGPPVVRVDKEALDQELLGI
jgi:hypothetical protein